MNQKFTIYGLGVLIAFALSLARGWELGAARKGHVPPGVRQSPGGYRSYMFWRGGK